MIWLKPYNPFIYDYKVVCYCTVVSGMSRYCIEVRGIAVSEQTSSFLLVNVAIINIPTT